MRFPAFARCTEGREPAQRHTRRAAAGAFRNKSLGNRRLADRPVSNVRQATTASDLQGANHQEQGHRSKHKASAQAGPGLRAVRGCIVLRGQRHTILPCEPSQRAAVFLLPSSAVFAQKGDSGSLPSFDAVSIKPLRAGPSERRAKAVRQLADGRSICSTVYTGKTAFS